MESHLTKLGRLSIGNSTGCGWSTRRRPAGCDPLGRRRLLAPTRSPSAGRGSSPDSLVLDECVRRAFQRAAGLGAPEDDLLDLPGEGEVLSVIPPAEWVLSLTQTLPHVTDKSAWCQAA